MKEVVHTDDGAGDNAASLKNTAVYGFQNPRPLPEDFPFYSVDSVRAIFSTEGGHLHNGGRYLSYYDGQCDLVPRKWQKIASRLFFRGGALSDFGLQPKPGIDPADLRRTLHSLLSSFEPKHEEKEATVGFALMHWCEPLAEVEAA